MELLRHPFFAGLFQPEDDIVEKLRELKKSHEAINARLDKAHDSLLELNGEGEWMLTFVKKGEGKDAC